MKKIICATFHGINYVIPNSNRKYRLYNRLANMETYHVIHSKKSEKIECTPLTYDITTADVWRPRTENQ